jgi:hypothetical protein
MSASAASADDKEFAHLEALLAALPAKETALPLGPEEHGEHSHWRLPAAQFSVRGPDYLQDHVKVPSSPAMFDLMHVDMFRCHDKMGNVAARSDSWLRAARAAGDSRYYFCVLYVTTAAPYIHLCLYFAVHPGRVAAAPHFAALWQRFTASGPEADAFRNERWKVIPRVSEGPWAVQYAVGSKPALLGSKLEHSWVLCSAPAASSSAGSSTGSSSSSSATAPAPDPNLHSPKVVGAAGVDTFCGAAGGTGRARGGSSVSLEGPGPYMEADCDVASSSIASVLVSLLQSSAR